MKTQPSLLVLALSPILFGCGESSTDAAESTSNPSSVSSDVAVTNPDELPSDAAGLAQVYEGLLEQLAGILEEVDTQDQLAPAYEKLAELKPAYMALMKRSEELNLPVEEGINDSLNSLSTRIEEAIQGIVQEFPLEAMSLMSAMSDFTTDR